MSKREEFLRDTPQARPVNVPLLLVCAAIVGLGVVAAVMIGRAGGAAAATDAGGVSIPLAELADGRARFYHYTTAAGAQVKFFVVRSSDGVVRAAFDTCDVCYKERKGYRQQGDLMVCNNCGQTFQTTDINVLRGGCNPAPLDRTVQGDRVVLSTAALESGAWYF